MELVMTDSRDERFIKLCVSLDQYLNKVIGGEKQESQYRQYNTLADIKDVILLVENGKARGCGSFKAYDEECAEMKRIFVEDACRGRGYGRIIVEKLEEWAKVQGYKKLILETGRPLNHAIKLYSELGYEVIENYGQYIHIKESVCMGKVL